MTYTSGTAKRNLIIFLLMSALILLGIGEVAGQEIFDPSVPTYEESEELKDTPSVPLPCFMGLWHELSFANFDLYQFGSFMVGKRTPTGSACLSTGTVIGLDLGGGSVAMFLINNNGDTSSCTDWVFYKGAANNMCDTMTLDWKNSSGDTGSITWTK